MREAKDSEERCAGFRNVRSGTSTQLHENGTAFPGIYTATCGRPAATPLDKEACLLYFLSVPAQVVASLYNKVDKSGLAAMKSHVLPNGLGIKHTNIFETLHLYQDIFVLKVYLQHGIVIPEHAVVIDGGANIGMFSMFVLQNSRSPSIHAFEPAPKTFEVLKANLAGHENVVVNNCGLGSHTTQEMFTYLPALTTGSGYYDDQMVLQMKERMRESILADPQKARSYQGPTGEELLNHHLRESFKGQVVASHVRALSDYFDEKGISSIDLLKLDVESKERAVLAGIRDDHWPMIKQAVIEVHFRVDDPMSEVLSVFEKRGFSVSCMKEEGLLTTMLYARRV